MAKTVERHDCGEVVERRDAREVMDRAGAIGPWADWTDNQLRVKVLVCRECFREREGAKVRHGDDSLFLPIVVTAAVCIGVLGLGVLAAVLVVLFRSR